VFRKCIATIDLAAVLANYKLACSLAPAAKTMAVVKADAYGHGAIEIAKALHGLAPAFAVSIFEEALELRDAGIREPILVLQGVSSSAALPLATERKLSLVLHSEQQLRWLIDAKLPSPLAIWLKIDTGMHRLGFAPERCAAVLAELRNASACADTVVVCTHLASAEEAGTASVARQVSAFDHAVAGLDVEHSIGNSAGIIAWPETHRSWNRPGYMLYGASPFNDASANAATLRPAMTLSSEVIALRDVGVGESTGYGGRWTAAVPSRIATVAVGYADGYPRHMPDGTPVLVNGAVAALAGTVSMDAIIVDVTALPTVHVGDPVELWGRELPVNLIAKHAGTSGYELLTRVSRRVPRVYLN
jgi:alanine racemase